MKFCSIVGWIRQVDSYFFFLPLLYSCILLSIFSETVSIKALGLNAEVLVILKGLSLLSHVMRKICLSKVAYVHSTTKSEFRFCCCFTWDKEKGHVLCVNQNVV